MTDFIIAFVGSEIQNYPFMITAFACVICIVLFFCLYTIVASIFRVRN